MSRPYRLFWSSKYFTPFRTVMSTPGSRCKLPANRTRTPDFHNRQNRNSRESSTFPIKFFPVSLYEHVLNRQLHVCNKPKRKKEKSMFFRRTCLKDGQTTNPCHSQHDVSFVIRTFTSFNLFRSWLCFALYIFLNNSWDFIFQFDILETVTQV